MVAGFPPKCVVIIGEPKLRERIRVLRHCVKCAQSHSTGDGSTYDNMDLDNNATIRDVWGRKYMFYIEDKHMNRALCKLFLSLVSPEIQRTFEEEMMANPNMKFKDMANSFLGNPGKSHQRRSKRQQG